MNLLILFASIFVVLCGWVIYASSSGWLRVLVFACAILTAVATVATVIADSITNSGFVAS